MGACERFLLVLGLLALLATVRSTENSTTADNDSLLAKERHRRLIPYITFYNSGQQFGDQPRYQPLDGGTSYSSQNIKANHVYAPLKPSPQIPYPSSAPASNNQYALPGSYDASGYAANSVYSPNNAPFSAKYNQGRVKGAVLAPGWAVGVGNRYSSVPYSAKYSQGNRFLPITLANSGVSYNTPYSAKYNSEETFAPHTSNNDANYNHNDNYLPQPVANDAKYNHNDNYLPQPVANDAKYNHKDFEPIVAKYNVPAYADVAYSSKYNDANLKVPSRLVDNAGPPLYVHVERVPTTPKRPDAGQLDTLSQILDLLRQAGRLPSDVGRTPVYRVPAPAPVPVPVPAPTTPKPVQSIDDDDYAYYDDDVDIPVPKSQANIKLTPLKPPFGTSTQAFPQSKGGTPGKPGVDYPILATIPETGFDCKQQRYKGFFGDPETNCQVWHYCDLNGGQASFLCPNGTIFSQVGLTCDWWFNVRCDSTVQLYVLNERLYKYILPVTPSFPEDYSGPVVDRYLTLKFHEKEEKRKNKEKESLNKT